jgi:hypothetical protein
MPVWLPNIVPLCRPYGTYAWVVAHPRASALGYIISSLRDFGLGGGQSTERKSWAKRCYQNREDCVGAPLVGNGVA